MRLPYRLDGLLTRPLIEARLATVRPFFAEGTRLLDVGCGLTNLPGRVGPYLGCDRSRELLDENRRRHPESHFVLWDVESEEAPEAVRAAGPFDVVLLLALLEHLAEPARAVARMAPLLARTGHLVATTPSPSGRVPLRLGAALGLLSRHAADEHEAFLSRADLEAAGTAAGLRLVHHRYFLLGLNQVVVFSRAG
ncbi:MAG: class I SAM-dependent methyltransferase [Thermoanaerobaculia bacterium]